MRVIIRGKVVEVERRTFTPNGGGAPVETWDGYLASDNPRYGADRISGPLDLIPEPGESVEFRAVVKARPGARGPWLSVWCVERLDASAA